MTSERWGRIKSVFQQAAELPPADRQAFLDSACPPESGLRAEVERLLDSQPPQEDFLEIAPLRLKDVLELEPQERRLAPGDVLCDRFRIDSFLGCGGMGEVYEAFDSLLSEEIAVKTIRAGLAREGWRVDLLRREVRRARKVAHPSVCRMYDLFTHQGSAGPVYFITMEILRGEMLDVYLRRMGPLPPAAALHLLEQVGGALMAAHRARIVHGDLKPANVFLLEDDGRAPRAVVTDFGLAHESGWQEQPAGSTPAPGPIGTLLYMAPEQLKGATPTEKCDLYSFALIAYELVTGALPFQEVPPIASAIQRSLKAPPPPSSLAPSVPKGWDQCIGRCLHPDPERRFASAADFVECLRAGFEQPRAVIWKRHLPTRRAALAAAGLSVCGSAAILLGRRWRWPRRAAGSSSIAVLAFTNAGADPEMEYLSDGISGEITSLLSRINALRVVSRTSATRFKGQQNDLAKIAAALNAEMILTGSVQRSGNRIHVVAELIDPYQGRALWSRSYDRNLSDVLTVQDEIASLVVDSLRLQMGRGRLPAAERRTQNVQAYDLYLRATYQAARRDETGLLVAAGLLQDAIRKDPYYALAHAELGNCYLLMADYGIRPAAEVLPPARAALLRGIELEPELAEAQAVLGQMLSLFDWDWKNAEVAFRRAIQLNQNYAPAYHWLAQLLTRLGRWDEGMKAMQQALRLDPVSAATNTALGWLYFYSGRIAEARRQALRTLDLSPHFARAHALRAQAAAHLGSDAEALAALHDAAALGQDAVIAHRHFATVYAILGRRKAALHHLRQLQRQGGDRQAAFIGFVCAYLRLDRETFDWLRRALEARDPNTPLVKTYPSMAPYHRDPRYLALLDRLNLNS